MESSAASPDFSSGEIAGLVFVVIAGTLSAVSVAAVLVYLFYSMSRQAYSLSGHTHYYFLNLMAAEFVQALGGMMTAEWVREHRVLEGISCNVQGVLKQLGDVVVAFTSMAIAIHTFLNIVWKFSFPPIVAPFVIIFMWTLAILFIAIPASIHSGDYYGNTGYWCWIRDEYDAQRVGLEYVWLYMAMFVSIICYACIAATVKGYNVRSLFGASREPPVQRLYQQDRTNRRRMNQMALQMMFYPAVYTITVFPIAIVRWTSFGKIAVPAGATIFASFLFSLSGFLNVILFGFTRRGIIPYPSHVIKSRSRTKSSFASPGMTNNPMTDTVASVYSQTGTYGGRFSQFPTSDYPFEVKDAPPLPALPPPSALHGQPRNMDDLYEVTFAKPNYPPSTTDSKRSSYWI
ncbi:hypothetical protein K523DRAFT_367687 [Schizophyllum commune Tattone D]|nr:hypothetical protein K523DRAFT_367687 [Schizophyllum commune Tattone D]